MSNIVYNFEGKVVLITGSSSGIGATTAILFAKAGANVVITSNNAEQLSEVAEKCQKISPNNSKPLQVLADVTKEEDLKRLVGSTIREFGKLDILVNNVGIFDRKEISDPHYMDSVKNVFQINLFSTIYLTHLCVEYLAINKGSVVNTSSIAATLSSEKMSAYSMTKSSIEMFTKCIAAELGPRGIRVNCVCPGSIRTPILDNADLPELFDLVASKYPVGRVGEPEDIANVVLYLVSEESSFTTGAILACDGGHIAAGVKTV